MRLDPDDADDTVVSFDVISLLTCVPADLAIKVLESRSDDIKLFTPIDKEVFFQIVSFCLKKKGICTI